jgi:predicted PurR-regulated permease PerM
MLNIDPKDRTYIYQLIAGVTAVVFILVGCLIVLRPFFPAILLATILALSTWPAFTWLNSRMHQRTALAAGLMTVLLAACFIAPLVLIGTSTADNFTKFYDVVQGTVQQSPVEKTANILKQIPFFGEKLSTYWTTLASDKERMSEMFKEYAGTTSQSVLKLGATIGRGLMDLTLGVLIAYFFFRHGTRVAVRTNKLIETFGGERGKYLLQVSKNTLIGVVYGMMGTALVQGALGAIGFWIAQVPGASFLGLMTFFISFVPGGPPIIWIPVALWLFNEGHSYMAIFIVAWGVLAIGMVDNVLRPYFVSRGSDLPFLLVLLGIVGGVLAFGFIGIFIGPTLLALAYALVIGWSTTRQEEFAKATLPPAGAEGT